MVSSRPHAIKNLSEAFLRNEFQTLCFLAGLATRNREFPIYSKNNPDEVKKGKRRFGFYLRGKLDEYSALYVVHVDDVNHSKILSNIANEVSSSEFKLILHGQKIRLGVIQKVFNLYLKYLWVSGYIVEPPHCPFDRVIKNAILRHVPPALLEDWTVMDSIDAYMNYVKLARKISTQENLSIAQWELSQWNGITALHKGILPPFDNEVKDITGCLCDNCCDMVVSASIIDSGRGNYNRMRVAKEDINHLLNYYGQDALVCFRDEQFFISINDNFKKYGEITNNCLKRWLGNEYKKVKLKIKYQDKLFMTIT